MQWIMLIGDEKLNLSVIKATKHYGSVNCYDVSEIQHRYCVDYGKDHIFYDYQGTSIGDYEGNELEKIPFKKPHFVMMTYTSEKRMKEVLRQDNFINGIYVDNGYNLIVPIEEFIRLNMPVEKR